MGETGRSVYARALLNAVADKPFQPVPPSVRLDLCGDLPALALQAVGDRLRLDEARTTSQEPDYGEGREHQSYPSQYQRVRGPRCFAYS